MGTPKEVYEHPASPFVYGFLGSVNLFHGRVHGDKLQVDEHQLSLDVHSLETDSAAVAYARPHEVAVLRPGAGRSGIPAVVRRILAFGAVVRLELERIEGGATIEAEISREQLRELALADGDRVLMQASGVRVFAAPERLGSGTVATS